jgi:AcrR family transcriptional regulator
VTSPPYLRIADDLRRRIDSGTLRPGARVPSTRALAKRWKVANATAARSLRLLSQEGLLRALPRSGTVVAGPVSSQLSRDTIVRAALCIADDEGLVALSIRGVASKLRAPVMSLYRHVAGKDELLALMVDAAMGELALPDPAPDTWRARLEASARVEWQMMRRHPWLARVVKMSRPHALPNALAFVDWVMRALEGTPLDATEKLQVHLVLHGFVQGLAVNVEAELEAASETGTSEDDHMQVQEPRFASIATARGYTAFSEMMRNIPKDFAIDLDVLFELGLAALLDGFTPRIEPTRAGRRVSRTSGAARRR